MVDPSTRWQTYGQEASANMEEALKWIEQSALVLPQRHEHFNTPEAFGGGKVAKPLFERRWRYINWKAQTALSNWGQSRQRTCLPNANKQSKMFTKQKTSTKPDIWKMKKSLRGSLRHSIDIDKAKDTVRITVLFPSLQGWLVFIASATQYLLRYTFISLSLLCLAINDCRFHPICFLWNSGEQVRRLRPMSRS